MPVKFSVRQKRKRAVVAYSCHFNGKSRGRKRQNRPACNGHANSVVTGPCNNTDLVKDKIPRSPQEI
jgi:hypothetical protein